MVEGNGVTVLDMIEGCQKILDVQGKKICPQKPIKQREPRPRMT